MKKSILTAMILMALSSYAVADSCDEPKDKAAAEITKVVAGKVEEMRATIKVLTPLNTEVSKQLINNLNIAIDSIEKNKQRAIDGAGAESFLQCKNGHKEAQVAVDLAVVGATGGLVLLLPPHVWHIDAGNILQYPLGSECSFVRNPLGRGC